MRCAIYARKSTDEPDKTKEDKSVARQIARAREFIKKRGWAVAEEHADDGISRAEFDKRIGGLVLTLDTPLRPPRPSPNLPPSSPPTLRILL